MLGFNWTIIWNSLPFLLQGAVVTIQISVFAILLGLLVGAILGLFSVSHVRPLVSFAWAYVQFFRGSPLLVQILWIYFGLPAIGIDLPAFWAGVLALGLNSAGYQAEIVRGGIESIDRGQVDAADSIGMSRAQTLLLVLGPQAVRRVVPGLTNELTSLVKSSSLLAAISIVELTHAGQSIIARTYAPFELYFAVAMLYLLLVSMLAYGSRSLEKRVFVNY
jgi:His/Glu/Gln/Arg/opine family amino acid ABC transporter permease subunit